jgi:hypothetical protein
MFQFDERFTRYYYAGILMLFMFYSGHTTGKSQMRAMGFDESSATAAELKDADHMAFHWNAVIINWIFLIGACFTMPMVVRRRASLYGAFSAVIQGFVCFTLFQANSSAWKVQSATCGFFAILNLGVALNGDFSVDALKAVLGGEGIIGDSKGVNNMGKYASLAGSTLTVVLGTFAAFQPAKFLDFYGWGTYKGTDIMTFEIQSAFSPPCFRCCCSVHVFIFF